jgi:hypothetical protein
MTVPSSAARNEYVCDGSQVVFPYTFKILVEGHLRVILRDSGGAETVLTLTTDYTVSGVGAAGGGNVTTVATYSSDHRLVILRDVTVEQGTDYVENDSFPAQSHEDALDKLTMIVQSLKEELGRCLKVPRSSLLSGASLELNASADRVLGWNASENALTNIAATLLTVTDFANLYTDYANDLAAAVLAIGSAGKTIVVDRDTTVSEHLTVPDNITLLIINGAWISVAAGKVLTIYSPAHVIAPLSKRIFIGSGSVAFYTAYGFRSELWDATGAAVVPGLIKVSDPTEDEHALNRQTGDGRYDRLPTLYTAKVTGFGNISSANVEVLELNVGTVAEDQKLLISFYFEGYKDTDGYVDIGFVKKSGTSGNIKVGQDMSSTLNRYWAKTGYDFVMAGSIMARAGSAGTLVLKMSVGCVVGGYVSGTRIEMSVHKF